MKIKKFIHKNKVEEKPKNKPKISILIPFNANGNETRSKTFKWLIKYLKNELPEAEIIVGKSKGKIFCKGEAFNDAAKKAKGKILVLLDADTYISGDIIEYCADKILEEISEGKRLWFVPYRHLFRLNKEISEIIIESDPKDPLRLNCPPPCDYIENHGHTSKYGHRYGAMCMIFPKEALEILGCFDERFEGWGGEDIALLRALDTLYAKNKTLKKCIFHLWHPFIGDTYKTRRWEGQEQGEVNNELANAYNRATGHPSKMRALVNEGCCYRKEKHKRGRKKKK